MFSILFSYMLYSPGYHLVSRYTCRETDTTLFIQVHSSENGGVHGFQQLLDFKCT